MPTPSDAQPPQPTDRDPADTSERISAFISDPLPAGALRENVEGRAITTADDGFGRLWRKLFWVRLHGADVTPTALIETWKTHYTDFWPKGSRLYQPPGGLQEGDVAAADLALIGGTRLGTGIVVTDEQASSFTFTTLQGHMLAGTITFSGHDDEGVTVAQVETIMRASDPLYEIGMYLGGHRHENTFWKASLSALATYYGVDAKPGMSVECLDKRRKWSHAGNIVHNAFMHTGFYLISRPIRRLAGRAGTKGTAT